MKKLLLLLLIVGCEEVLEPEDCAGVAGGTAVEDCAGICGGDTTQAVCDECSSLVFDCAGVCEGNLGLDECGACGGNGMQISYVEECEIKNVCGNVTTTTSLGSNSYCANGCSSMNGQYCTSNQDCYYSDGFASSGCNTGYQCITTIQETEYVCANEMVCENIPITSCP